MTLARFAEAVIEIKKSGRITLPQTGPNPAELKSWLATQGSPSDFPIPAGLESHKSLGCQSFMIEGRKVSLICFQIDEHRIVHFFVVDSEDLLSAPGRSPHFFQQDGLAAVTWSAHGRTFILTGKDVDEETLRSLIS